MEPQHLPKQDRAKSYMAFEKPAQEIFLPGLNTIERQKEMDTTLFDNFKQRNKSINVLTGFDSLPTFKMQPGESRNSVCVSPDQNSLF